MSKWIKQIGLLIAAFVVVIAIACAGYCLYVSYNAMLAFDGPASLTDVSETEPVDLSGLWVSDPTPYLVERSPLRPEGHELADEHGELMRREGIITLDLTHNPDGYVYGTYSWEGGAAGEERLYTGTHTIVGTFDTTHRNRHRLLMISDRHQEFSLTLLYDLNEDGELHGVVWSIDGPMLMVRQTLRQQPVD